jgi:DNA-binding FadR family transcriptional regulator
MVRRGYFAGACEADLKFHETLLECAGNKRLYHTYINSHIPLFHQQLTKNNQFENDYELTDKEHRAIVKALKEKNAATAEKVMRAHFLRGAAMIDAELH